MNEPYEAIHSHTPTSPVVNSKPAMNMVESGCIKPRGVWIIFLFILGAGFGLALAASGWQLNLEVYMIKEFNVKSIDAALVNNVVSGCIEILPLVGAVLADSFLGSFSVVLISAVSLFLGVLMFALTAIFPSLRPPRCEAGSLLCKAATPLQSSILYVGTALCCVGLGWSRLTIAAMGAEQLDVKHQEMFFNWYFALVNVATLLGSTVIVYVEGLSWAVGFGLVALVAFISVVIFVAGHRFYVRVEKLQSNPYTSLLQVVVAATRNIRLPNSNKREDYYDGPTDRSIQLSNPVLNKSFSFLNKAALINISKPDENHSTETSGWKLCTLQQVEDLKSLIRILPVMSATILISTSIAVGGSLSILQCLAMDRRIGNHFKIPVASMTVFMVVATTISLALIDRLIYPSWKKLTGYHLTILQRVGATHVFIFLGLVSSALVESQRLKQDKAGQVMSILWLVPQLVLFGVGETFQYGQVVFCYKEFPEALRSTATSMQSLTISVAFYLSTIVISVVRTVTKWLPNDIDNGRLDNVYWMLCVITGMNFMYYIICARLYKYKIHK